MYEQLALRRELRQEWIEDAVASPDSRIRWSGVAAIEIPRSAVQHAGILPGSILRYMFFCYAQPQTRSRKLFCDVVVGK
jgi:hypothetical protein